MTIVSKEAEGIAGLTLDALLLQRAGHRLPAAEALDLFVQVLATLADLHGRGAFHGNIQPASVVLEGDGVQLTTGTGAGPMTPAAQTLPSLLFGNSVYMSPEQLRSVSVDHRTDLYSAAVVLFEILAGRPPFQGQTDRVLLQRHLTETPPDLGALVPGLPAGISEAIAIALRKEPQERFPTAHDFLCALREGMVGLLPLDPLQIAAATLESEDPAVEEPARPTLLRLPQQWSPRLIAAAWILIGTNLMVAYGIWGARPPAPASSPPPRGTLAPAPTPSPTLPPTVTPSPSPEETPNLSTNLPEEVSSPPEDSKDLVVTPVDEPRAAPSPTPPGPNPAEIRSGEVASARAEARQGLEQVSLDLEAGSFDTAQTKLDELMERAQGYPGEMQEEIRQAQALRTRLIDAEVEAKARIREAEIWRESLERRLQQIEGLVQQKRYPEAIGLAKDLSQEPRVPEDVTARARELASRATEELKKIGATAQWGPTRNEVRKKPPKD